MAEEPTWMIYGATGYTGRLIAREALQRGQTPILAGRNGPELRSLGAELDLPTRIFTLDNPEIVARQLRGVAAVLHCAGPFSATSTNMLAGCLRAHTHYLDITGEIAVFEAIFARAAEFQKAGIVVMPGVGYDVVPSDGLAALLKQELPDATQLTLAFGRSDPASSRGTLKTMVEATPYGTQMRQDGRIVRVDRPSPMMHVPPAGPPIQVIPVSWGDVSTAYHATGIPTITVYFAASAAERRQLAMPRLAQQVIGLAPVQALLKALIGRFVWGPSDEALSRGEMWLWGEVRNSAGKTAAMHMRTPSGYAYTADAAVTSTLALLRGVVPPGAYTTSMAFGANFTLGLRGVSVQKVDPLPVSRGASTTAGS
jgi:short subunit dehydrogenase-like uncharacterized protein